ncbi:amidohydrolase family protein [Kordiimonas sp. SCSIO 12603]|uniref:amidohydrolase family protein n=1 Tax=Kordiimonas sp. SCSIO 12603 TaxID=2829596 RepID=UPI00210487DA|nr:amidohydrolase family protein [Kordiimonas sp. SCSIO 12603]UTW58131.1 amidohydrolase family protein [Kordiimonas sp. SCSIO 12603]
MKLNKLKLLATISAFAFGAITLQAQDKTLPGDENELRVKKAGLEFPLEATARTKENSHGPYKRLVIRGATMVDGTGAPPIGPVDIVIEGDRITGVHTVGNPGVPINEAYRPEKGDYEIDAHGAYVLPGFVDSHSHVGNALWGLTGPMPSMDYVFKLWMAHGITTSRTVACGLGADYTLRHKERSDANEIVAPRLLAYCSFPTQFSQPKQAVDWVKGFKKRGGDGIKFFGGNPTVLETAIKEAKKQNLGTAFHHAQVSVTRVNVLDSARWGLDSMEHWYGLPEALFTDRVVQDYPLDYNYQNEQHRFGEAGKLWQQAAKPGSKKWNEVMEELLELDFTLSPTFTIYEANRDVMRAKNADWHPDYTLPSVTRFFTPNRILHGSYHFDWTTQDEINWKENFRLWMQFVNDYKNRGGRVTTGSDSGFIYKLFGFDYIREFELLQEAGFHPLEVIKSATLNGAELIGREKDIGSIEVGKLADLVIVEENPIQNFKVLYGTGHMRMNDNTGKVEQVGGVRWTIKDGIIYDAKQLRKEVRDMVKAAKENEAEQASN